eukprot:c607_g1_i1.p1 GENE.c607_g1_i1~~c607_g1_i1.p1  ORF type:complete len:333 (+),score=71.39 c607_g1_i1:47-1045(+)
MGDKMNLTLAGMSSVFGTTDTKVNTARALVCLKHAVAVDQSAIAAAMLGLMYGLGLGVPHDTTLSRKWALKALQMQLEDLVDSPLQHGYTHTESECVRAYATFVLGRMSREGIGVTKDFTRALKMLHEAAYLGAIFAWNSLGLMYDSGEGVPKQWHRAMKYFQTGADLGDAYSSSNLGCMHFHGDTSEQNPVPPDRNASWEWYGRAADHGHCDGLIGQGTIVGNGSGRQRDTNMAMQLYSRAIATNLEPHALTNLGVLHIELGNVEKGVWFVERGANLGDVQGMVTLWRVYSHGIGVQINNDVALAWLTKAKQRGSVIAQTVFAALNNENQT